mmetsp:Transcript_59273/g.173363  ORF Transcript_59273/g.173363 Transcript_59273/m.173363 type:complete len:252 (-) Transcript_59273:252-1007(-)
MFWSRRSSLWASFCASGLSCALRSDSRSTEASSSSSSSSSSGSPPSSPASPPASPRPLSLRISRWSSWSCRRRTVSRSSSSVRLCIFELISRESLWTSRTRRARSRTSSRRSRTSAVSRTCWRSAMESCERPAAVMSASTEAEAGQRARFWLPKRPRREPAGAEPWRSCGEPLCSSSATAPWTSCTSGPSSSAPPAPCRSCSSLTLATRKGEVCAKLCTSNLAWPSTDRVTTLTSLSPTFVLLCAWEAMRQ